MGLVRYVVHAGEVGDGLDTNEIVDEARLELTNCFISHFEEDLAVFGVSDVLEYGRLLVGGCAYELGNRERKNFSVLYGDLFVVFFLYFLCKTAALPFSR